MHPVTIRYAVRPQNAQPRRQRHRRPLRPPRGRSPPHHLRRTGRPRSPRRGIVLCTGPSGSGKSSLLRALGGATTTRLDISRIELPDRADRRSAWAAPSKRASVCLAACGLSEARLFLRTPDELSEGQRYRFRLAYALDSAARSGRLVRRRRVRRLPRPAPPRKSSPSTCAATSTASAAAKRRSGFLLATTHDDLTADLDPDLHVEVASSTARRPGGRANSTPTVKKKRLLRGRTCGSPKAPAATGRTSLGGITARTTSPA